HAEQRRDDNDGPADPAPEPTPHPTPDSTCNSMHGAPPAIRPPGFTRGQAMSPAPATLPYEGKFFVTAVQAGQPRPAGSGKALGRARLGTPAKVERASGGCHEGSDAADRYGARGRQPARAAHPLAARQGVAR